MATIFLQGDDAWWFVDGSVIVKQDPIVRTPVDAPDDDASTGTIHQPLNFRNGRLTVWAGAGRNLLLAPSITSFFPNGRLGIVKGDVPAVGGLSDFAVWASAAAGDPADIYIMDASALNDANVGSTWNRHYVTFALPAKARYFGIGAKFTGLPGSGTTGFRWHYLTRAQVEDRPAGATTPTTFEEARSLNVVVHPDRLNLAVNPSAETDTSNANGVNTTVTRTNTWHDGDGAWAFQLAPTGASNDSSFNLGGDVGALRLLFQPGRTYTVSATINTPAVQSGTLHTSARRIQVFWRSGSSGPYSSVTSTPGPVKGVARLSVTVTFPATATEAFVRFYNGSQTAADLVYWDNILIERTDKVLPYFDASPGGDYVWEVGGTPGSTRSYYYKNRAERFAAIKRILADNTPMGIGAPDPQFANTPVY